MKIKHDVNRCRHTTMKSCKKSTENKKLMDIMDGWIFPMLVS